MASLTLGWIGVGRMGSRMARHLVDAGHHLTICDTDAAAVRTFTELGATAVGTPRDVADAVDVVFVSLPTPPVVERVALGPDGVVEGTKARYFVDTSTSGSATARRVFTGLAAQGIVGVDCPVSGGLAGAEAGNLALMLACPTAAFEELEPIVKPMGHPYFIGPEPGQGQTMKLLNNLLSATAMAISAEALVLGKKAGLDPALVIEVINAGTGRNTATETKIPKFVLPRKYDLGFPIGLLDKDVRLCLEEAKGLNMPMVVGTAVEQLLAITSASEGYEADMTTIVKTLEKWAGVEV